MGLEPTTTGITILATNPIYKRVTREFTGISSSLLLTVSLALRTFVPTISKSLSTYESMSNSLFLLQRVLALNDIATEEDATSRFSAMCAYDKAQICKKALNEGYFPSARRLAEAIGGDQYKDIWLYVSLGSMPSSYVDAFENKKSIQLKWIRKLQRALLSDHDIAMCKSLEVQRLRTSGEKWPAAKAYKYLTMVLPKQK